MNFKLLNELEDINKKVLELIGRIEIKNGYNKKYVQHEEYNIYTITAIHRRESIILKLNDLEEPNPDKKRGISHTIAYLLRKNDEYSDYKLSELKEVVVYGYIYDIINTGMILLDEYFTDEDEEKIRIKEELEGYLNELQGVLEQNGYDLQVLKEELKRLKSMLLESYPNFHEKMVRELSDELKTNNFGIGQNKIDESYNYLVNHLNYKFKANMEIFEMISKVGVELSIFRLLKIYLDAEQWKSELYMKDLLKSAKGYENSFATFNSSLEIQNHIDKLEYKLVIVKKERAEVIKTLAFYKYILRCKIENQKFTDIDVFLYCCEEQEKMYMDYTLESILYNIQLLKNRGVYDVSDYDCNIEKYQKR